MQTQYAIYFAYARLSLLSLLAVSRNHFWASVVQRLKGRCASMDRGARKLALLGIVVERFRELNPNFDLPCVHSVAAPQPN